MKTAHKIKFLQSHMNKWAKRWQKLHPENIVGFRIDKKIANGVEARTYSIIFQVATKYQEENLKKEHLIPSFFSIKFPDGVTRKVQTDVEQTEKFEFHLKVGSDVYSDLSAPNHGSAGLFLKDNELERVFMLTNYHVAAWSRMKNGYFSYDRPSTDVRKNVKISDNSEIVYGRFETGIMSSELDIAFIELFMLPRRLNELPNGSYVNGFVKGSMMPSLRKGTSVNVYKPGSMGARSKLVSTSSTLVSGFSDITFRDLILIEKITSPGDSGSLVVISDNLSILGIVMGGSGAYTYVVPFYKINNFNPLTIL